MPATSSSEMLLVPGSTKFPALIKSFGSLSPVFFPNVSRIDPLRCPSGLLRLAQTSPSGSLVVFESYPRLVLRVLPSRMYRIYKNRRAGRLSLGKLSCRPSISRHLHSFLSVALKLSVKKGLFASTVLSRATFHAVGVDSIVSLGTIAISSRQKLVQSYSVD